MNQAAAKSNKILGALSDPEWHQLHTDIRLVRVPQREVVHAPLQPIMLVYFPLDCVLSMITVMENGDAVESGVVGCEGFSAPQLALGARVPESEMICQVPGRAVVMRADSFRTYLDTMPGFRDLVTAYLETLFNAMGQQIACNRLHTLTQRCARWLLATHDRVGSDSFQLTHEFLAIMLGVARTAVTAATGVLQQEGLITSARGVITIVDRARLEDAACECYGIITKGLNLAKPAKVS